MKSIHIIFPGRPVLMAFVCAGFLPAAFAGNTNTAKAMMKTATASTPTNSIPVDLPVPVAVFDVASMPTKDPFFPMSLRQPIPATTNAAPAFSAASFALKGLSGPSSARLAMINNRTFGVGDTNTVTTASGKINIRCVQIKENSVVLRAESQTDLVEIFLRKAAQ